VPRRLLVPDDSDTPISIPTPTGEPAAGTEPGGADVADDTVLMDPGSAGDNTDVAEEGQPAVTPADPAAGESAGR
jgi:hypothetical protein